MCNRIGPKICPAITRGCKTICLCVFLHNPCQLAYRLFIWPMKTCVRSGTNQTAVCDRVAWFPIRTTPIPHAPRHPFLPCIIRPWSLFVKQHQDAIIDTTLPSLRDQPSTTQQWMASNCCFQYSIGENSVRQLVSRSLIIAAPPTIDILANR